MSDHSANPPQRPGGLQPDLAQQLTQAILARTSGSPCLRFQAEACALVDGELDGLRRSLLRGHLEHCAACSALVAALEETKAVLPLLAEIPPGPRFVHRVLRATVQAPPVAIPQQFEAHAAWWKVIHRPRIRLEAAYLSAAAGLFVFYAPTPTLPLTSAAPAFVRAFAPKPALQALKAPVQRLAGGLKQSEQRTLASLRRPFQAAPEALLPGAHTLSAWQRTSLRVRGWLRPRPQTAKPTDQT